MKKSGSARLASTSAGALQKEHGLCVRIQGRSDRTTTLILTHKIITSYIMATGFQPKEIVIHPFFTFYAKNT